MADRQQRAGHVALKIVSAKWQNKFNHYLLILLEARRTTESCPNFPLKSSSLAYIPIHQHHSHASVITCDVLKT